MHEIKTMYILYEYIQTKMCILNKEWLWGMGIV